jgi:L-threonylcarbamoyladenylate synthase
VKTEVIKIANKLAERQLNGNNSYINAKEKLYREQALDRAAALIKEGSLVAFPTETVYGLGANAFDEQAVSKIFTVKGRPCDNPLIVHIAEAADLEKVAKVTFEAQLLAKNFWPGPLTMVLAKKASIPDLVTCGLPTVAVRCPDHAIARDLIKKAAVPLAAPSANTSGRPSPTLADHVLDDLAGKIPLIIDGGAVEIGLESTVLDLSGSQPRILRPGKIGAEELKPFLGEVLDVNVVSDAPLSPGTKYAHYSPQCQVILAKKEDLQNTWQMAPKPVMVLCFQGSSTLLPPQAQRLILAEDGDFAAYGSHLFASFRTADMMGIKTLIVETVDTENTLGKAIMNRLEKAAFREEAE